MAPESFLAGALSDIIRHLNDQSTNYALAGGWAFSALVEPRATTDIDALEMLDTKLAMHRPPAAKRRPGARAAKSDRGAVRRRAIRDPIAALGYYARAPRRGDAPTHEVRHAPIVVTVVRAAEGRLQ